MYPAARVGDSIEHEAWADTNAQPVLMAGAAVAVIISGGTVTVFLTVVGLASTIGQGLDWLMSSGEEKIKTGARTVFTNLKAAALAHEKCKIDHGDKVVYTGAEHVFIEEGNASRLRDLTTCPGYIKEGSTKPNQVLIGGRRARHERPGWYKAFLAIDMSLTAASLASSLRDVAAKGLGGLGETRLEQAWTGTGMLLDTYGLASGSGEIISSGADPNSAAAILDYFSN
jgi:hypothetical protein